MKTGKFLLPALALALSTVPSFAQIDNLHVEMRGSYNAQFTCPGADHAFEADYLNLRLAGHFGEKFSYMLRQRLNKPLKDATGNPFNATDILKLTWHINPHWHIEGGKLPILLGGYEWDDAPIDLFIYTQESQNMPTCYGMGGAVIYIPREGQTLMLQVTSTPLALGLWNSFHIGLSWTGKITSWWKTIWSVNAMRNALGHTDGMVALGNRFEAGKFSAELDGTLRCPWISHGYGEIWTAAVRLAYTFSEKWNLYAKYCYDKNNQSAEIPDNEMEPIPFGTEVFRTGLVAEFFPLGNDDIRLHAMAGWDGWKDRAFAGAGLTLRLPVIREGELFSFKKMSPNEK